jgi:hypothetical protein
MKERIRELAEQATTIEYGVDNGFDRVTFDQEKFAELIIQECSNVLMKESERLYQLVSVEKDELFARDFEVAAEKCLDNVEALREHFFGF